MADAATRTARGFFGHYAPLWPSVLGLAFAYAGLAVATQGSLRLTDEGVFTDGAAAVALIPCLIVAAILYKTRYFCTRDTMRVLVRAAIAVEAAVLLAMGLLRFTGNCTFPVRFALSVAATLAAAACIACWLRRAHDDEVPLGMERGAVLAFGAMMAVTVWIVMQLLAAGALVLYCAFPGHLEIGAIATTMLGTLMTVFVWHLIVAYLTSGWRDPFYYAAIVWSIWTLARAFGRFVVLGVMPTGGDSHFTGTVISFLLLVSTQLILVKLIDVSSYASQLAENGAVVEGATERSAEEEEAAEGVAAAGPGSPAPKPGGNARLERILGLDEDSTLADARSAVLRHNAELMGAQFLLSEREIEVLALYASGFTQKRVAEELHISQTTAHTHIGRIYAKTGLHSRQELLDYMRQYGDM